MHGDGTPNQRQSSRRKVLFSSSIEVSGASFPVIIRDLSSSGALIEGEGLPVEGAEIILRIAKLRVGGRVAWVDGERAGLTFSKPLPPKALLRKVSVPPPLVQADIRRPGFRASLSKPTSSDK